MIKAYSKFLTATIALFIVLTSFFMPTNKVSAIDSSISNKTTLATMEAKYTDSAVLAFLQDNGIEVNSNDLISLVSYSSSTKSVPTTEVEITSINNNSYKKTLLQSYDYDEDGNVTLTDVPIITTNITRHSKKLTFDRLASTYKINMVFNMYYDYLSTSVNVYSIYLAPIAFDFVYHYTNGGSVNNCNLSQIYISYQTQGELYKGTTDCVNDSYLYPIYSGFLDPIANITYTKTDPITSGYYIHPTADNAMCLSLRIIVNGKTLAYTIAPNA